MPDDSKKKLSKKSDKNEPKEQRKPRQSRPTTAPPAIPEKKEVKKDPAPETKTQQVPGPEFYKGLKRETDEILRITEESNAKYNSKEIQSNWKKYEMPIDSYEEIEEQENMGADYEKLIQTPMSIGGHFQFKHEKSWDSSTGPSEYDKYFDIYSENLGTAICTIPFYERNGLDETMFSEIDLTSMRNKAVKYKQKYYNDKSYTTPDLEVIEKTTNIFKACISNAASELVDESSNSKLDINLRGILSNDLINDSNVEQEIKDLNLSSITVKTIKNTSATDEIDDILEMQADHNKNDVMQDEIGDSPAINIEKTQPISKETIPKETADRDEFKKSAIESPEDLEKWLDDFLDN